MLEAFVDPRRPVRELALPDGRAREHLVRLADEPLRGRTVERAEERMDVPDESMHRPEVPRPLEAVLCPDPVGAAPRE
jgi:hypothetical protein